MHAGKATGPGEQASGWPLRLLPIAAAVLLAALDRQQAISGTGWASFLSFLAAAALAAIPLAAAHLLAERLRTVPAMALWGLGFSVYPVLALKLGGGACPLSARHFVIAAVFSAAALLAGSGKGRIAGLLHRLPLTLDWVAAGLLAIWAVAVTSLFGSTPDAVNNQPLQVWFDPGRLIAHPLEFASYFIQFGFAAALLFGFYGICRHVLVRRVLASRGWIAMALAGLSLWIVYTPLAASLILLLPLNPPDWSLLPSENHNPFDPVNYGFTLIATSIILPIVLASERLLAQRREALGQHERVRAELQMLQQQINPHFLFNSLNTVYALCLQGGPQGAEAVAKLSELLRYAVYRGQDEWVGLDDEIAHLGTYIDLQMLRFGSRCVVTCAWPDQPTGLRIPPMVLLTLVENAFKHGVEPIDGLVTVHIELELAGPQLRFECRNAPLPAAQPASPNGLGLGNLRRRLELLFDGRFILTSAAEGDAWVARLECGLRPC